MDIQLTTQPVDQIESDWLIVAVAEKGKPASIELELDEVLGGQITRLRESDDLTGKLAETLAIHDTPNISSQRILFVGLGEIGDLTLARFEKAMTTAVRHVSTKTGMRVAVSVDSAFSSRISISDVISAAAIALHVGCRGQELYATEPKRFGLADTCIIVASSEDTDDCNAAIERGSILGDAVNVTRDLVNRTAQDIYPESVAQQAKELSTQYGFECDVFDEDRLQDEKMGSLLAVARGSDRGPRVVVLKHNGATPDAPTLALVGKGVTFDSGGLSLKPTEGMLTMKCDMAGAATVLGAFTAIARLNLKVNVVGYLGLVENMVSGSSYKLGDVLTARNGVTIEVHNTDAEGRLVLADVLSYASDQGAAKIIDLATLTGACVVALGQEITGVFSNNEDWSAQVRSCAEKCGENTWSMPMLDDFNELIKSDVADIKNVGPRWGGAITAAKFLEKFVDETPWVHLDIAGPSFASANKPHREGGATGCMVRTLVAAAASLV